MRRRIGAALITLGVRVIGTGEWVRERGLDLYGRTEIDLLRRAVEQLEHKVADERLRRLWN